MINDGANLYKRNNTFDIGCKKIYEIIVNLLIISLINFNLGNLIITYVGHN